MFSICKIKNLTGAITTLRGHEFAVDEIYTIQEEVRLSWSNDDNVLSEIAAGNFEIHDATGPVAGLSVQIGHLKNNDPTEVIPTTPKNDHNMRAKKVKFVFTPESDGNGGYLSKKLNFKLESETHIYLKLWGSKVKVIGWHKDDYANFNVVDVDNVLGYGENVILKQYADWFIGIEDGKIICPSPPCGSPGTIPNGIYVQIEYFPHDAAEKEIFVNWVISERDGDEIPEE